MYYCTPKALYNHVVVGGGGVSPQSPPVCSLHLDDEVKYESRLLYHIILIIYVSILLIKINKCCKIIIIIICTAEKCLNDIDV